MAKLSYKFVNPGLTSKDKETLKVAGVKSGSKTKLPSSKILLGINRIGLAIEGIGETIKGLKSIEEVRAISLRNKEVEERRSDRDRQLDQKEASQERGRVGGKVDEKKLKDETKRKHGAKIKKAGGFLQQLLQPLWNLISPFISFAAVMGILKWFQDEKNQKKVKKLVEFAGVVFKFLYDWATFGVSTLLDGFGNLFGGISKIQKGELGGVWDTIMGFGQLLVGFVALKGLAMFMNPFSLMGGILDMLNVLSMDTGPDLPDMKNQTDDVVEGALKKKSWLMKFKQRIRIMYKRITIRWKKKVLKWFDEIAATLADIGQRVLAWGKTFFDDVVRPLIDRAVKLATDAFDNIVKMLPDDLVKGVTAGIDTVKDAGSRLLKNADDVTKPLRDAAKPFVDDVAKVVADPGAAIKQGLDTTAGAADDLFRWVANTGFGKSVQSLGSGIKGAWDVTSDLAVKTFQSFKSGLDDFIKGVTEIPSMVANQWTKIADDVAELAAKGKDFVVEKFLAPLKQGADDLIKNSPIGEFFVKNFADDAIEEGGTGLFKQFVGFAEPAVKGVKEAMDAAPFKIGPLDVIVDVLLAAMELKAGQNPTRVALKLTGSILGLIAGTAILGAIGAGTGGIGAAILAGVVTGATQWGGEWLAGKLADMIGIPDEEVSFLDAFDFSDDQKGAMEGNGETPQASAGGLIRGVKMSMGGAIYGDTNEKAVLNALADAEGTSQYPNSGYNTQYTGKQFSGTNHPREILGDSSLRSDAAGRYQFLSTTWDGVMGDPISPDRQDQAALKLIKGRGVDLSNGLQLKEIYRLGGEWASVEGGPQMQKGGGYGGQAKYTAEKFLSMYTGYGGKADGPGAPAPKAEKYDPEKKYKVGDIVTKDGKPRVFDGMGWGAYTAGAVTSQGNVTQTLQGTSADSFEQAGTDKGSNDSGLASLAVLQGKGDDGFGGAAHKLLQAFAALFPGITLGALKPAKEKADGDKSSPGDGSPPVNETGRPNAANVGSGFDEKFAAVLGSYEGLRLEAYADANYGWEIPTIGIGATYYPPGFRLDGKVKKGDTITEKEAYEIKAKHIVEHRQRLLNELGSSDLYTKVPNNVKVALESKVFNYGSMGDTLKGIVKSSIASGDYQPVADHFRNSLAKHNGGINSWRRNDEAGIIETGKSNRTGVSFQMASAGGRIHMAAGGMLESSQKVAVQQEAEESELMAVPVPKMIPMPINRTQGVTVQTMVSGASDNTIRFENY